MRWTPLFAACVAGLVAFEIARPKFYLEPIMPPMIRAFRLSMLMIALGVPFALDDPSEETVASAPTRLWVRRAVRIALAGPVIAAAWLLLVWYASHTLEHLPTYSEGPEPPIPAVGLPAWGLGRQFVTIVITALALSALGARLLPERIGSIAAGPALLAIIGATMLLPARLTLFVVDPILRVWTKAQNRWTIALAVATVWLMHTGRDSGRLRLGARTRRAVHDARRARLRRDPIPARNVSSSRARR